MSQEPIPTHDIAATNSRTPTSIPNRQGSNGQASNGQDELLPDEPTTTFNPLAHRQTFGPVSGFLLWLSCAVLTLPAFVPVVIHFYYSQSVLGHHGTGFIQYDQAYYMANARQCFDDGVCLTYKNPFDYRKDSPAIYCQPHIFLLGAVGHLTRMDPVLLFLGFGSVFSLLTIRCAFALLGEFVPLSDWRGYLIFVLFVWGGGLYTLLGTLGFMVRSGEAGTLTDLVLQHDPFQGWWFLNLGRNFVFPMESYYHFLFLLSSLLFIRRQWSFALATGFLLSWSHPFTGLEFLCIAVAWLFLERMFFENQRVPALLYLAAGALLIFHIAYYKVFLTRFETHREVHERWTLGWEYQGVSMLLGYGLVGGLTLWRIKTSTLFANFFERPAQRFLFVWFAVAFLLANHEFFMKPIQPLHFTRGYVWMPLFLAGAPVLFKLLTRVPQNAVIRVGVALGLSFIFLLDNAYWLAVCSTDQRHNLLHTRVDHAAVMKAINQATLETGMSEPSPARAVVVSNSSILGYLAAVETPHDVYFGHGMLTPGKEQKRLALEALFSSGTPPTELDQRWQLVIVDLVEERPGVASKVRDTATIIAGYRAAGFDVRQVASDDAFVVLDCRPQR